MTDPSEIAAWEKEQRRESERRALVAFEQHWRDYKAQLAVEAGEGRHLGLEKLADDLAMGLVPPLLPQGGRRSDCGDLSGPELRDPAGYIESEETLAAYLMEIGILSDAEELRYVRPRRWRDFGRESAPCTAEARDRVRARLRERFSQKELAQVWSEIHRLGFDHVSVEAGIERSYSSGPRAFRLLRFAQGRTGRLVFSDHARPTFNSRNSRTIREAQAQNEAELRRFFETDAVAIRVVDEIESELAGQALERCPQTAAQFGNLAMELRSEIEANTRQGRHYRH